MNLFEKEINIEFHSWEILLEQFYQKVEKIREDFHES